MNHIFLDTETTGLTPEDRIIQIGILHNDGNYLFTNFNPEIPVHPEATKITGITDAMLENEDKIEGHLASIKSAVENASAVIGYNIVFDQLMIDAEMARAGFSPIKWPTLVCLKRLWDIHEPKRDLMLAYRRFVDPRGFDGAHSALVDAKATMLLFNAMIGEFQLAGKSLAELDPEMANRWITDHIMIKNDVVSVGFGKKWKGSRVELVDSGYWHWMKKNDFPKHVVAFAVEVLNAKETTINDVNKHMLDWCRAYEGK